MLRPARILPALAFAATLTVPLASHAIEQPCPQDPQSDGFVAPTAGTQCVVVTETYEGSENRLGLPVPRRYLRLSPQLSREGAPPLLVLLHARDTEIEPMANLTRVGRLVRDHGITVVLPEGIEGKFNDDPITPPTTPPALPLMDDVAFIATVIADELEQGGLDSTQVFIAGYSNGGFMAQRMVCERPQLFAGLGSVASSLRFGLENSCPGTPKAMPRVFMHGTADEVVLYRGLPYRDDIVIDGQTTNNALIAYRSAPDTALFWAERNGCSGPLDNTPIPSRLPSNGDGTTVDYFRYNCAPGIPPVIAYRINGGGHTWPGSLGFAGGTSAVFGPITTQLDATTAFWTHFTEPNAGNQARSDQLRTVDNGGGGWGLGVLWLCALGLLRWRQSGCRKDH